MRLNEIKTAFILHIFNRGFITKKTQNIFHGLGYYMMIWSLRDNKIVYEDGVNVDNEKVWRLTEKGKKIGSLLRKRQEIYDKTLRGIEGRVDSLLGE